MMDTKILIIEDEIALSESIRTYFETEGYDVKVAADGSEGISFFKMYDPDITILDITLPKKDGWQVCREIRENSAKPIIMPSRSVDNPKTNLLKRLLRCGLARLVSIWASILFAS